MLQAPRSFCMEGEATARKTSGEFEERLHVGGMKYLSLLLLLFFFDNLFYYSEKKNQKTTFCENAMFAK